MFSIRVRWGSASLVLLPALVIAGGCKQRVAGYPACGDKTVEINANVGANPEAVYVCEDDTVDWIPNPKDLTFEVQFKNNQSPFKDDDKKFDKTKHKSKGAKKHLVLKVYQYSVTVYTPNPVTFDPQVIGGGKP